MDSRSEFLAWFSALRWAKSNHDLTVAFHNPQTTDKKNVCLSSKSFKSKIRGKYENFKSISIVCSKKIQNENVLQA